LEQQQKFIQEPTNIYIKWLRSNVTELEIKNAFAIFGNITSVYLTQNPVRSAPNPQTPTLPQQNVQLNFAFVNFLTAEEAKQA
jgi:RNA recognition motif-containing protein